MGQTAQILERLGRLEAEVAELRKQANSKQADTAATKPAAAARAKTN